MPNDEKPRPSGPESTKPKPVAGNPSVPAATTEEDASREAPALSSEAGQPRKGR
jgi:hypothetical protein